MTCLNCGDSGVRLSAWSVASSTSAGGLRAADASNFPSREVPHGHIHPLLVRQKATARADHRRPVEGATRVLRRRPPIRRRSRRRTSYYLGGAIAMSAMSWFVTLICGIRGRAGRCCSRHRSGALRALADRAVPQAGPARLHRRACSRQLALDGPADGLQRAARFSARLLGGRAAGPVPGRLIDWRWVLRFRRRLRSGALPTCCSWSRCARCCRWTLPFGDLDSTGAAEAEVSVHFGLLMIEPPSGSMSRRASGCEPSGSYLISASASPSAGRPDAMDSDSELGKFSTSRSTC